MAMNGENNVEEAEMTECDGEKVVTMMDVLQEQQEFEEDANAVLGASDDMNCTYPKGYIKRQALYACLTCCADARYDESKQAGVCLACSLNCHENHDLIELYTKRNFRCDCGNPKFNSHPCQFTQNKTELNTENNYNQNFSGIYCVCRRPYPDPDATEEEEMIQCIICEDWLHTTHLEAAVPSNDQYSEMVCKACMEKNDFLHDYSQLAVNIEMAEIDIVNVNGNDTICNGDADSNLTNGDITDETKANGMQTETNLATNDTKSTTADNEKEANTETSTATQENNDNSERMDTEDSETSEIVNHNESETNNEPVTENTKQVALESPESTAESVKEDTDTVSDTKTDALVDSNFEETQSQENKEGNGEITLENHENTTEKESVNPDTIESQDKADANEVENITDTNDDDTKEAPDSIETSEDKPTDAPAKSEEKTTEIMNTTENELETSDNFEGNTESTEGNDESSEENKKSTEENKESVEEIQESVEENIESSEKNKESVEENEESAEENKESVEENEESAEENKESAEENKESAEENKESAEENKESAEENKESTEENKEMETKPDSIETDKNEMTNQTTSINEQNSTNDKTNGSLNTSNNVDDSTEIANPPEKRKLADENDGSHSKKPKLDMTCIRPKNVKRIYKGATFWPSHFRQKLCTCNECISMYKDLSVLFLTDPEDTVSAYEMLGKQRNIGEPSTQYEKGLKALSSLNRVQQINALTEYNKMRDKLLDFLKSFKDKKEVVKEEDIRAFFAGMKPKREPDGVYFCR